MHALASLLLSLPLLASASTPHLGSLRRSHWDAARAAAPVHRRGATYTLEERFEGQSFFEYVPSSLRRVAAGSDASPSAASTSTASPTPRTAR